MQKQDNASKINNSDIPKSSFWSSPGAKFIITGIITFLLLVPTMMVWGLVEERADRAEKTATSISKGWGGEQTINGPYLAVPYRIAQAERVTDRVKEQGLRLAEIKLKFALISPANSEHIANVKVEARKKSIYTVPVYHMKSEITGSFDKVDLRSIIAAGGTPDLKNAFLVMGVSDTTGFRSQVVAKINGGAPVSFEPGLKHIQNKAYGRFASSKQHIRNSGINLSISEHDLQNGFKFNINMALNGSRKVSLIPNGKNTKLKIKSNWPHPGFDGQFLPETREINEQGFNAQWTIPNLARGIDSVYLSSLLPRSSSMVVNFVEPLKFYQLISRSLKYSIAFFSLVFLAVFILELMGKKTIHWIQYILVGLAMIVFYILLLALAEHIGFTLAYLSSAIASTFLVSWYVGTSIGQKNGIAIMAIILGLTYAIVYLVLKEAEYALLAGALIAFFAIATTMYATRKVDWSANQLSAEAKD